MGRELGYFCAIAFATIAIPIGVGDAAKSNAGEIMTDAKTELDDLSACVILDSGSPTSPEVLVRANNDCTISRAVELDLIDEAPEGTFLFRDYIPDVDGIDENFEARVDDLESIAFGDKKELEENLYKEARNMAILAEVGIIATVVLLVVSGSLIVKNFKRKK